jgi:hypothetical protein
MASLTETLVAWIKINHPDRTTEYEKCTRDINLVIEAMNKDINQGTTRYTQNIANKFWRRGESMLQSSNVELEVYEQMRILTDEGPFASYNGFGPLIDIVKNTLENGPIYESGSWEKVINNRIMTFNWTDEIPDESLIQQIIDEVHEYVPSKQRRVRYNIHIIRNYADAERRYMIYAGTKADPSDPDARHNPQVLAPWLMAFSTRPEGNDGKKPEWYENEANLDVGLAVEYISLSALNKGLDTGFCACIQNRNEMEETLGFDPIMYVGIGYRNDDMYYTCPVYNRLEDVPNRDQQTKPSIETYTHWM